MTIASVQTSSETSQLNAQALKPAMRVSTHRVQEAFAKLRQERDWEVLTLSETPFPTLKSLVDYYDQDVQHHPRTRGGIQGGHVHRKAFYQDAQAVGQINRIARELGAVPLLMDLGIDSPTRRKHIFAVRPHEQQAGIQLADESLSSTNINYARLRAVDNLHNDLEYSLLPGISEVLGITKLAPEDCTFLLLLNEDFDRLTTLIRSEDERKTFLDIIDATWDGRQVFREVITQAFRQGASDVHFDALGYDLAGQGKQRFQVRFCIDGSNIVAPYLLDEEAFKRTVEAAEQLAAETGAKSALNRNIGFDGAINLLPTSAFNFVDSEDPSLQMNYKNNDNAAFSWSQEVRGLELRYARVPIAGGTKKVTVRLHKPEKHSTIADLGFTPTQSKWFLSALKEPNGIILVTGPTGSGKSTTLYTALRYLNTPDKHIVTIEDPVENRIPGITQMQLNVTGKAESQFSFADANRALLRLAPHIVLIGEVRDEETAEASFRAANSGHLVLTTLHTNDAVRALPRLVDFKIDSTQVADYARLLMAQRLLPKINPQYVKQLPSGEVEIEARYIETIDLGLELASLLHRDIPAEAIMGIRPKAEEIVNTEGYRPYAGRMPVIEILMIDEATTNLIETGASPLEIKENAMKSTSFPYVPHEIHALVKALRLETSIDAVWDKVGKAWLQRPAYQKLANEVIDRYLENSDASEDELMFGRTL